MSHLAEERVHAIICIAVDVKVPAHCTQHDTGEIERVLWDSKTDRQTDTDRHRQTHIQTGREDTSQVHR